MSEIKLKPCPFCGGKAVLFVDGGVRVMCTECSASSKVSKDSITVKRISGGATESVIRAWNRRADTDEH